MICHQIICSLDRNNSEVTILFWTEHTFGILGVLVDLSVGSMRLPVKTPAWQKYCYLQIEWVELIFLLACGKAAGNV